MSPVERSAGGGGGGGGGFTTIFTTTLAAPATSIDITGIPGTFTTLRLYTLLRSDGAVAGTTVTQVVFNGDTGANYDFAQVFGNSGGAGGGASSSITHALSPIEIRGGSEANLFGTSESIIAFYANTSTFKTIYSLFGTGFSTANLSAAGLTTSTWRSTAVINRITLSPNDGTHYVTGCVVLLEGQT